MKKLLSTIFIFTLLLIVSGCSNQPTQSTLQNGSTSATEEAYVEKKFKDISFETLSSYVYNDNDNGVIITVEQEIEGIYISAVSFEGEDSTDDNLDLPVNAFMGQFDDISTQNESVKQISGTDANVTSFEGTLNGTQCYCEITTFIHKDFQYAVSYILVTDEGKKVNSESYNHVVDTLKLN